MRSIISEREKELPESTIGKLLKIAVENKDVISLGPGETKNMGFNVRIGFSALSEKNKSKSAPGKTEVGSIIFKVTIPLTYSTDLDSKDFRTTVTYEFPNFKEAYLVESKYE